MFQKLVFIGSGVIIGLLLILLSNVFVFTIYPFPEYLDWFKSQDRNQYIMTFPINGLKSFIFIHLFGVMVAGFVTSVLAKHNSFILGIISSSLVFTYIMSDLLSITYPQWFYYLDIPVCIVSGLIGTFIGTRRFL